MINVVMPMLGEGSRMKNLQNTCKPLYKLPDGTPLFIQSLKSLVNYEIKILCLVVLEQYEEEFQKLLPEIKEVSGATIVWIIPHKPTKNQVESFMIGYRALYNLPEPVLSLDCDIYGVLPKSDHTLSDGHLFAFKHTNPNKSFIDYSADRVIAIKEKVAISNMAVFGAYMLPSTDPRVEKAAQTSEYMSGIIDYLLSLDAEIFFSEVTHVQNYGTLEEFKETTCGIAKTYKALCFDFDGTLFDTKKLNFKAYQLAYFDLGVTIDEDMFAKTDGLSVYDFNHAMGVDCNVEKLRELKAKYYAEMSYYAKPNQYLIDLISRTNLPTALVTTARLQNIKYLLETYDLHFDVVITQEDVKKHKPDPEAYTKACQKLHLAPEDCLAFEDSRPGFVSARSAGLDCVMVKEFQKDCIRNMSGGSDATTKLLFTAGKLLVRKEAFGAKQALRLKNQCDKLLREQINDDYISVIDHDEDKDWFMYDMPYRPAPSLYEYINKIKLLPELLRKLASPQGERTDNEQDVRQFCYDTYIIPGMKIYEQVTGKKLTPVYTDAKYIPKFVNNFRITNYHGDSTLENVLVERDQELLFIDPVPDGNAINGIVHDFSKVGQSLTGYEAIRDGKKFDYDFERHIFNREAQRLLTEEEYQSLKFHTACLLFRRLKHQVEQNPKLVKVYGDIAQQLLSEFAQQNYSWE